MTCFEKSSRSIFCLSMIFSEKPVPTFPDHVLSRTNHFQELADLEFEGITFLRQRSRETVDLFRCRLGVSRTAADIREAAADLDCALRGLLDIARNFLRRGALLFHRCCDGCRDLGDLADRRSDCLDGRHRLLRCGL